MIAGVWGQRGRSQANEIFERLAKCVPEKPRQAHFGTHAVLGAWDLPPGGRLDVSRDAVIAGFASELPASLELENASRTPGDYAVIAGHPSGLLLARGRFSGRCLYFHHRSDGVVAACSRLEPLLACVEDVQPDVRTLASMMVVEPSDDPSATVFARVKRVESSHACLVGSNGITGAHRSPLDPPFQVGSVDEVAEELRFRLAKVIRRYVDGSRRVAVLLSGGLDSSSVLAQALMAARGISGRDVDAVTWSFGGPGDDRPYAKELCDAYGIAPARVSSSSASVNVVRMLVADAAPFIWPAGAGVLTAIETARARGADLILTGEGGDHVFGGDPRIFARRAWSSRWRDGIARAAQFGRHASTTSATRTARLLLGPPVLSAFPFVDRARRRRWARQRWSWAGPKLREFVSEAIGAAPPNREWRNITGETKFKRLADRNLLRVAETRGQMDAASGVAGVDPLRDSEIVALVASLPQEMLLYGGHQRGLFRHAMRHLLPEGPRLRPDKARFEPAIAEMVAGSDLAHLRHLAGMTMLADIGLVEPKAYRRQFDEVLSQGGESRDWLTIWPALSVEAFARRHWSVKLDEPRWRANL